MRSRFVWLTVLGLGLGFAALPLSQAWGGKVRKQEPAAAEEEKTTEMAKPTQDGSSSPAKSPMAEKSTGLVGTIVAVVPDSRTMVVDVPIKNEVLRLGVVATDSTKIRSAGGSASFASLKEGDRVRINYRRVEDGDEAVSVEVLRGQTG